MRRRWLPGGMVLREAAWNSFPEPQPEPAGGRRAQGFLDSYLKKAPGEIDYIHGDSDLVELAQQDNAIGFLLPAMEKSQLFRGVIADGILPRKTFSMGHAREKRYYLEGRTIIK